MIRKMFEEPQNGAGHYLTETRFAPAEEKKGWGAKNTGAFMNLMLAIKRGIGQEANDVTLVVFFFFFNKRNISAYSPPSAYNEPKTLLST